MEVRPCFWYCMLLYVIDSVSVYSCMLMHIFAGEYIMVQDRRQRILTLVQITNVNAPICMPALWYAIADTSKCKWRTRWKSASVFPGYATFCCVQVARASPPAKYTAARAQYTRYSFLFTAYLQHDVIHTHNRSLLFSVAHEDKAYLYARKQRLPYSFALTCGRHHFGAPASQSRVNSGL